MKKSLQNKLILFSLASINLFLFFSIASVWYIANQGKKNIDNIRTNMRKELNNVEKISESLSDLAKVAKNIDPVELKETTEKIVKDVIKELGEARRFLDKKSKELSLTLEERLNLNELNSELSKIGNNLAHLKNIEVNLENLKDIGEGVSGLKKSFSNLDSLDNLEGIKNEIGKLSSKINSEEIGKGIGSQIDNNKIAENLKKGLKESLGENWNSLRCEICKEIKAIDVNLKSLIPIFNGSVNMSITNDKIAFRSYLKEEDWINLIKEEKIPSKFPLKFRIYSEKILNNRYRNPSSSFLNPTYINSWVTDPRGEPNWTDLQDVYEINKRNKRIILERKIRPFSSDSRDNNDEYFDLKSAIEFLDNDSNSRRIRLEFNTGKEIDCKCGNKIELQGLDNSTTCLLKILKGIY